MQNPSRRSVILGGGALGALGAVAAATPAWAWESTGSIAGSGTGADPGFVWDDPADTLVRSLLDRGAVPAVNAALRNWTYNGQALPPGLPTDVVDFIESARRLPTWADPGKLRAVTEFTKKRGNYLGTLYGLGSGMMSTAIPKEARAVYYSKGGANMKDRVAKTAKLGYDIGTFNAYQPDGEMVVTAVKTRLVHAAVRNLLTSSTGWAQTRTETMPISQADMLVTWHSLPTFCMRVMRGWNVQIPTAEADAFLHLWQVSAHMLGIRDEYIPATWQAANAQSDALLDPVLGPTQEGIALAAILMNLAAELDHGASKPLLHAFTRYLCGDRIADWMQIPREPVWDPFVRANWPGYVAAREAAMPMPLAPEVAWAFDEMLRRGVLMYLSDGRQIHIEMPDGNRTF